MSRTIRILSIDGGGIRGIIPAICVAALERQSGCRAGMMFDMMAGTSSGAILIAGLAKPNPLWADEVLGAYITKGAKIFSESAWRNIGSVISHGKYDHRFLEQMLDE